MKGERTIALAVGFLFLSVPVWSQKLSTRPLAQPVDWTTTESAVGMIFPYEVQVVNSCVYLRRFDSTTSFVQQGPVVRIGADGKESSFDLTKVPDSVGEVWNQTWFVNSDGSFYAVDLFRVDHSAWLASYNADGKFQWKVRMAQWINSSNVILPMDGDKLFLVSGSVIPSRKDAEIRRPISAIFDRSGKIVQDVTLSTDAVDDAVNAGGKTRHVNPMARAAVDSDGFIYLMRQSTQPKVQVFSPAGELVRTMELALPDGAGWAMDIYADHGQLIVKSVISDTTPDQPLERATPSIIFYDSATGKATSGRVYYGVGIPVSFRDGSATFLNSKGQYFAVGHAPFN